MFDIRGTLEKKKTRTKIPIFFADFLNFVLICPKLEVLSHRLIGSPDYERLFNHWNQIPEEQRPKISRLTLNPSTELPSQVQDLYLSIFKNVTHLKLQPLSAEDRWERFKPYGHTSLGSRLIDQNHQILKIIDIQDMDFSTLGGPYFPKLEKLRYHPETSTTTSPITSSFSVNCPASKVLSTTRKFFMIIRSFSFSLLFIGMSRCHLDLWA